MRSEFLTKIWEDGENRQIIHLDNTKFFHIYNYFYNIILYAGISHTSLCI